MTEFALVLPFFAILLFGLIDLGRYVAAANTLSNAAREGARAGSVGQRPSPQCDGLSREQCVIEIARASTFAVSSPITTTVTCERVAVGDTTPNVIAVSGCGSNDLLKVRTEAEFTLVTPLIAQFIGDLTISGESRVTVNQ